MRHNLLMLIVLGTLAATAPGCSFGKWARGENFREEDAKWGESLREPGRKGELFGLSERARQVERNVGVR